MKHDYLDLQREFSAWPAMYDNADGHHLRYDNVACPRQTRLLLLPFLSAALFARCS